MTEDSWRLAGGANGISNDQSGAMGWEMDRRHVGAGSTADERPPPEDTTEKHSEICVTIWAVYFTDTVRFLKMLQRLCCRKFHNDRPIRLPLNSVRAVQATQI